MSAETRARAAVALVTAQVAAHEDRVEGRDYRDVVAAAAASLDELFADGRPAAVATLLSVIDAAVSKAAFRAGTSRPDEARRLLRRWARAFDVDVPRVPT